MTALAWSCTSWPDRPKYSGLLVAAYLISIFLNTRGEDGPRDSAYETAPDFFQIILETNVDSGSSCPVVFNVSRNLAPNSTDRFWSMVTPPPAFFQQSAFYHVIQGAYAEFGISGQPGLNSMHQQLTVQLIQDHRIDRNVLGSLTFMARQGDPLGLRLAVCLRDRQDFDQLGYAPFAKVCTCLRMTMAKNELCVLSLKSTDNLNTSTCFPHALDISLSTAYKIIFHDLPFAQSRLQ